jgi:hypothetical protein
VTRGHVTIDLVCLNIVMILLDSEFHSGLLGFVDVIWTRMGRFREERFGGERLTSGPFIVTCRIMLRFFCCLGTFTVPTLHFECL